MNESNQSDVTQLLVNWSRGDKEALDSLFPLVYEELRRLARNYLRRERPDHTLQPTALVNEAFMRMVDQQHVNWQNRTHFFAIAANMMRRILINHAEAHNAAKRGGSDRKVMLDEAMNVFAERDIDLLALDEALTRLGEFDKVQARIVELRFFGGLTNEEVAEVTDVSLATVKREWAMAKTWLLRELTRK